MTDSLIGNERLKEITGYVRDGEMAKNLKGQGIACFVGRNGVWTTTELIKEAGLIRMGLRPPEKEKVKW